MIWVLDTSTLFHKPLLRNLVRAHALSDREAPLVEPILPTLAYVERLRQIRRDEKDESHWKKILDAAGINVEPFTYNEADRLDPTVRKDRNWRDHARDFLIRCHVHDRRFMITDDTGPAWKSLPTITSTAAANALSEIIRRSLVSEESESEP